VLRFQGQKKEGWPMKKKLQSWILSVGPHRSDYSLCNHRQGLSLLDIFGHLN
jgi:hypothetical protein